MTSTTLDATKPAIRSRGVIGSAGVIAAMAAKLIWGVDLDDGLQVEIVETLDEWVVLGLGTVALIGRLRAAARVTSIV